MKITDVLKQEHAHVKALFESYHKDHSVGTVTEIVQDLKAHMRGEEDHVYPAFKRAGLAKTKLDHAAEEHDEAKALIAKIDRATGDDQIELMEQLEAAINHHINEEEKSLFPTAEKKVDADVLEAMGENYLAAKNQ